jgi:hypothetical protein
VRDILRYRAPPEDELKMSKKINLEKLTNLKMGLR